MIFLSDLFFWLAILTSKISLYNAGYTNSDIPMVALLSNINIPPLSLVK